MNYKGLWRILSKLHWITFQQLPQVLLVAENMLNALMQESACMKTNYSAKGVRTEKILKAAGFFSAKMLRRITDI